MNTEIQTQSQTGWIAWVFSSILFVSTAALTWLYVDVGSQKEALSDDISRVQNELANTERSLQRMTESRDRQTEELGELRGQLAERSAREATLNSELGELNRDLNRQQTENARLNQQIQELQTALENSRAEQVALNETLNENSQQLASLETELASKDTELVSLQDELEQALTTEELYLNAREQLALQEAENETYEQTIERLRQEMQAEAEAMAALESQLQSQLTELNQTNEQLVTQLEDGTTAIKLPESILFATGSAEINEEGKEALANLATALNSFPNHLISVQGHSDGRSIGQNTSLIYPSNWELSSARAAAAVRTLIEQGMPAEQMQAVGFADTRPLVEETNAVTRSQNRRIEVLLLPNKFTTKTLDETVAADS